MTTQEWHRLREYWHTQQLARSHKPAHMAKRHAKGHARGVGQTTLKTAHIVQGVSVERVFVAKP